MIQTLGDRQQEILKLLSRNPSGLSVDELAESLNITRPAVNQHLAYLESMHLVRRGEAQATGGRPKQSFCITGQGIDLFPKKYSWFSSLLIQLLRSQLGSKGLETHLEGLAQEIAGSLNSRVPDSDLTARLSKVVELMNELSFDARQSAPDEISASNCIYHHLASDHPEVCKFDIALLSRLSRTSASQTECIVRGGRSCRFKFQAASRDSGSGSASTSTSSDTG